MTTDQQLDADFDMLRELITAARNGRQLTDGEREFVKATIAALLDSQGETDV